MRLVKILVEHGGHGSIPTSTDVHRADYPYPASLTVGSPLMFHQRRLLGSGRSEKENWIRDLFEASLIPSRSALLRNIVTGCFPAEIAPRDSHGYRTKNRVRDVLLITSGTSRDRANHVKRLTRISTRV